MGSEVLWVFFVFFFSFFVLFTLPHGSRDLSFPARDQT